MADPTLPFAWLAHDPMEHLAYVQDMRWFLREQLATLSDGEFWDWLNSQDEEDRKAALQLMTEPAFSLRDHQIMPRADQQAYHVKPLERIQSFADWRRQPRVLNTKPNGDPMIWRRWFCRMGRGAGKTHAASCNVHDLARYLYPGLQGILVAPVVADARDVMIDGESGLINTAPPDFVPRYIPSQARVEWPNGSFAILRTAEDPQSIRGPSIYWGWADELAKWKSEESYKNFNRTIRNKHPAGNRMIITTSPISAQKWVRDIESHPSTITTVASTFDNPEGLDETALDDYAHEAQSGSQSSREEYYAEWQDKADKLWKLLELEALVQDPGNQTTLRDMSGRMDSRLLSIDPSGGVRDEHGITLLGKQGDLHWALGDFSMEPCRKSVLLAEVARIYREYMKPGDRIVVETNVHKFIEEDIRAVCPGAYVEAIHQNQHTGSKAARAQRAQILYEDNKVRHLHHMPKLHQQMDRFYEVVDSKSESPDRVDALAMGLNWYQDHKPAALFTFTVPSPSFRY